MRNMVKLSFEVRDLALTEGFLHGAFMGDGISGGSVPLGRNFDILPSVLFLALLHF